MEQIPGGYCVVDAEGKRLAYVYGLDEKELAAAGHQRLTKHEARRIAANIAKLPELLGERKEEHPMTTIQEDFLTNLERQLEALPPGEIEEHDLETVRELLGGTAQARLSSLAERCQCRLTYDTVDNKISFTKSKSARTS